MITLTELQAASDDKLLLLWQSGIFPFDWAKGCTKCATQHHTLGCVVHPEYTHAAELISIPKNTYAGDATAAQVRENLEAIYSLRLFFRDLYESNPPELDELNVDGTVTGRLDTSESALQNVPMRSELGAQVKAAFRK